MLSMISEPFYFDLRQLKDEDLSKEIIIKIIPFDEERKIRRKKQYDLKYNCKDNKQTVTFKLTSRARPKTNDNMD